MKNLLPIVADMANGLFATILAGYISGIDVLWWHFLIGVPLAMLPDLDALPELLRRGKVAASSEHLTDHREALHFPILFLVVSVLLIIYFGWFGWLFFFATTLHFINDLYGTGWGIPLFWPLTDRRYKLFGRRANRLKVLLKEDGDWDNLSVEDRKFRIFVSWSTAELPSFIKRWGEEYWIERWYMRLTWISGIEYSLFVLALSLATFTLLY